MSEPSENPGSIKQQIIEQQLQQMDAELEVTRLKKVSLEAARAALVAELETP